MTSPHPPERASATLRAICLHSVVWGRATGRCVSSFRNPLFAWSGSRSRIHFSVGCASLTRSNGLRTAFERFPAARAVRTALQLTRRAERNFLIKLGVGMGLWLAMMGVLLTVASKPLEVSCASSPTPTEQQQKDTGQ